MSWIPVEERLPEANGEYLNVTVKGYGTRVAYRSESDGTWRFANGLHVCAQVIAWQPLPAPYVKPRRFVVLETDNPYCGPFMVRDTSECRGASFNIPTREAAEKIADIYEEAYRGE